MNIYFKLLVGGLITAILTVVLTKQCKDYALLLTLAMCIMVLLSIVAYLQPLISFFNRLTEVGNLNVELLHLLLKITGIGFISQIASMVCADAGSKSLSKALQLLTSAVILWLTLPILEQMLSLIETVLEAI